MTPSKQVLERVKQATVALAFLPEKASADRKIGPFVIVGSGFCIAQDGIIVTCEHVLSAFMARDWRKLLAEVPESERTKNFWPLRDMKMSIPKVLFFFINRASVDVVPISIDYAMGSATYDIGLMRLQKSPAFQSYPYLEMESFEELYEGMEVATCGFPLGNEMERQLGTVTSSFTKGILSSVIPARNSETKFVTGFQLDLTATNGNSGGPVFNWETGKVFGALASAPVHSEGNPVAGFTKAESIYRILDDGSLTRFRSGPHPGLKDM